MAGGKGGGQGWRGRWRRHCRVKLHLLQLISKLQLLSFALSSPFQLLPLPLLLLLFCLFRFILAAATRSVVAACCSLVNAKKALILPQRVASWEWHRRGQGVWQANMARITGTFDGDIARITGINAQTESAAAAAEQQGRGAGTEPGVVKSIKWEEGGPTLFKSRDAFAGTKLTENHMKVAKAHCATRQSKVAKVVGGRRRVEGRGLRVYR